MIKKLGEVCQFYSGTGFPIVYQGKSDGDLPFYKVGDIASNVANGNIYLSLCNNYISRQEATELKGSIIPKDTIVFAKIGEALKLNRRAITSGDCLIDNNAMGIAPKATFLRTGYFYYFMKHLKMQNYAESTTVPSVRKSKLEQVEIEVPALVIQEKIEQILNKTAALVNVRQQQLQKLDELVKARFVELFGTPDKNPYGWDMSTIGSLLASCEAGWSGNGAQREKKNGEIAVLKVSAVTKGYFIPSECKVLDDQSNIKKYVFPQAGDLLFSRANTREMVGATAVITQDYPEHILPDKLWKIRFVNTANVWYMKYVLSCQPIRSIFSSVSTGTSGSMFNVSMEKFKSIVIPLPPLELQMQFASFVESVDKSKATIQKALDEAQLLFDSLMQKYFG